MLGALLVFPMSVNQALYTSTIWKGATWVNSGCKYGGRLPEPLIPHNVMLLRVLLPSQRLNRKVLRLSYCYLDQYYVVNKPRQPVSWQAKREKTSCQPPNTEQAMVSRRLLSWRQLLLILHTLYGISVALERPTGLERYSFSWFWLLLPFRSTEMVMTNKMRLWVQGVQQEFDIHVKTRRWRYYRTFCT